MKSDSPANGKLLNLTVLAVLSPIYALAFMALRVGALRNLTECWSRRAPFAEPLLYIVVLAFLASIVWLLRRGTVAGPIAVLAVTVIASAYLVHRPQSERIYELAIGAGRPVLGIDVYCNDVHLGKTPLNISESEFNKLVKPWDTPPDQPGMIIDEDDDRDRYSWAKFFYVPHDIFETHKQWPPDHKRYNRHNDKETLEDLKNSEYWWRFEKNGCVGLARLSNFGGGSSGSNNRMTIRIDPQITFASAQKHLDALIVQLQADNLQPTNAWLDHFVRYKDLLFLDFHTRARRDDSLRPTLDAIVRAEFGMPAAPSESDCRRVVDEIVSRADKSRCFTIPSLESVAIEMVGKANSQPIVDRFIESANLPYGNSEGRRSSGTWTTYRRSGPRARLLPLEYAVKKTTPAQLFDRLVYMSRKTSNMDLLGNYPREELVWLFQDYLNRLERQGGRMRKSRINEALRMCIEVRNPLMEDTLHRFVVENAGQGHSSAESNVRNFVESRINDPAIDQGQLARWVFHWAPLKDGTKLGLLPKIQDSSVSNYLYNLVAQNERLRKDVIQQLGARPNPALDKFIIATYNWYESPRGPGYWSVSMTRALVTTDTPAVRGLIKDEWSKAGQSRSRMIRRLNSGSWRQPKMNWLVPMIAELDTEQDRILAARLLSRIDTAEAYELADKWSSDPDSDIAKAAAGQLGIRDARAAQARQRLSQAAELVSGNILPDDLLAPAATYKWNGAEYVADSVIE